MNSRLNDLFLIMFSIQEKMCLLYKNISVIDGQYNIQLKTAAKVMSELMKKRAIAYDKLKVLACEESDDLTDEGYELVKKALNDFKSNLMRSNFTELKDFMRYVIRHTDGILRIIQLSKERAEAAEFDHEVLLKVLTQIEAIETETRRLLVLYTEKEMHYDSVGMTLKE